MVAFIVVAVLFSYLFIGGLVGNLFYAGRKHRCDDCSRGSLCCDDHGFAASLMGVFWLPALPMLGGMYLSRAMESDARSLRASLRHERRMEKVNAENESRKLEIEKARLNIRFLEENGVKANVDGLFQ